MITKIEIEEDAVRVFLKNEETNEIDMVELKGKEKESYLYDIDALLEDYPSPFEKEDLWLHKDREGNVVHAGDFVKYFFYNGKTVFYTDIVDEYMNKMDMDDNDVGGWSNKYGVFIVERKDKTLILKHKINGVTIGEYTDPTFYLDYVISPATTNQGEE